MEAQYPIFLQYYLQIRKNYLFTLKTLAFFISLVKTGNILLCITLLGLKDKSALIQNVIVTPPEK